MYKNLEIWVLIDTEFSWYNNKNAEISLFSYKIWTVLLCERRDDFSQKSLFLAFLCNVCFTFYKNEMVVC